MMVNGKSIIYGLAALLAAFLLFSCINRYGTGSDVQNNGSAAHSVREQLGEAISSEREAAGRVQAVEDVARSITEGIERSEAAVADAGKPADAIEAGIGEAGELIARSQQILGEVRRGGKAGEE